MPVLGTSGSLNIDAFGMFGSKGPRNAPTALVVNTASSSQLNLRWVEGDPNANTEIFRNDILIHTTNAGVNTYPDTGLSTSTTYYYKVRHTLLNLKSANTSVASNTTDSVGVTAVSATTISSSQINVLITYGDATASVELFRDTNPTPIATYTPASAPSVTFNDTGRSSATTHTYYARHEKLGIRTGNTASSPATTLLDAPTAISATEGALVFPRTIGLSFTDADTTASLEIFRTANPGTTTTITLGPSAGTRSPYTDTVDTGVEYTYRIRNTKNGINTSNSTFGAVTTSLIAPTITSIANTTTDSLDITWTNGDSSAATEIEITSSEESFSVVIPIAAGFTNHVRSGLTSGTQYSVRLRHVKNSRYSSYTESVTRITKFNTPTITSASVQSDTSVALSFVSSEPTANVQVYRDGSLIASLSGTSTSVVDSGLTPGRQYSYDVRNIRYSRLSPFGVTRTSANTTATARPRAFFTGGVQSNVHDSGSGITYRVHVFNSGGDLTRETSGTVEYMLVGGGGGGGNGYSGGGGGGGVLFVTRFTAENVIDVQVGAGGAGSATAGNSGSGGDGGNSRIVNKATGAVIATAIGGGGGGAFDFPGRNGGSGGGGGCNSRTNWSIEGGVGGAGGSGTTGQGYPGGLGRERSDPQVPPPLGPDGRPDTGDLTYRSAYRRAGGGGGGAGGAGGDGTGVFDGGVLYDIAGDGGQGITNAWTGTSQVFGSGGGGSCTVTLVPDVYSQRGTGGTNAGNGAVGGSGPAATAGVNNYGGGGGAGASGSVYNGAAGGSGTVHIRYPIIRP